MYVVRYLQGASCLARSLKVVNEALTSVDLGFNEIRVKKSATSFINTVSSFKTCKQVNLIILPHL